MKATFAVLHKRGGRVAQEVTEILSLLSLENSKGFGIATPSKVAIGKDAGALQNQKIASPIVIGFAFSNFLPYDKQQYLKLNDATLVFDGEIYSPTWASIAEVFAKKLQQAERDKASEALIAEAEGAFSFIITEPQRIIAGRDPIGVQPLYYGENRNIAALASNRNALWRLGMEKTQSFPPGHLAFISRGGFKFKPIRTLIYSDPKPITMQNAAKTLKKMLERSVRRRVSGTKEIAVAFSGGLDSSVIALLAKKCRANVCLIHVSLENRPETEEAKKAAEELSLPLQVYLFREADVEKLVFRVVKLIEEADPVKTSIGIPFYWIAEKAAEAGINVLLSGQGADELFGGYQRYVTNYLLYGKEKVRRTIFNDIIKLHESNIERDVKICSFHDVDLRLPFASYQIAEFASNLPIKLKIERRADTQRKLVLRKVALDMGLSSSIVEKPKKAVQYATGINDVLKKLAKKQKATVNEYVNNLFSAK